MTEPNLMGGLIGGSLIGLAAVLLLAINGRSAGVSGILGGLLVPTVKGDRAWRAAFLLGLIAGAALYGAWRGTLPLQFDVHGPVLVIAGVLVGIGTRLGSGCTSGHGVCGLARRSPRSLLATVSFMAVAMLTVYLTRHILA